MKSQISTTGLLIVAILTSFGFKHSGEAKTNTEYHLFKIGRSRDANEIVYDINIDKNGEPVRSDPINIYWVKKTNNNKVEPLTWIQKRFAYGLKILDPENSNEWHFHFVSYSKQIFSLRQADSNQYKVFATIKNTELEVNRIFVQIDGGSFWVPTISYVKLIGIEHQTGEEITLSIIP